MAKYALIVLKMSSISKSFRANFFFFLNFLFMLQIISFCAKKTEERQLSRMESQARMFCSGGTKWSSLCCDVKQQNN